MNSDELSTRLTQPGAGALVPEGYAEKAMASLMQLHSELMEEKERRVDLYRRLMEKEQSLAELRMYVKALEERVSREEAARAPLVAQSAEPRRVAPPPPAAPTQAASPVHSTPAAAGPRSRPKDPGTAAARPGRPVSWSAMAGPRGSLARPPAEGWRVW
jgi:hypothetical protein